MSQAYDGVTMADPIPSLPSSATLVVHEAITKLEALDAMAETLRVPIQRPATSRPFVVVGQDSWAEVEIPKFGEAPPLSIDVYSANSAADAEARALALMALLAAAKGWAISPMFAR